MKQYLICSVLISISILSANSQTSWFWQYPYPQGAELYSIKILDANTIIAAGKYETIIKTTNDGQIWSVNYSINSTTNILSSVSFINQYTGWVSGRSSNSGDNGLILKTTNSGNTWISMTAPANTLLKIQFVSPNIGWVSGQLNKLYKTTNGGVNWVLQQSNISGSADIVSISFLNENTGWIVGISIDLAKTTNGGMNWYTQGLNFMNPLTVQFISENTGYVVGKNGKVYKTSNAGIQWYQQNINTTADIDRIFFQSASIGWLITKAVNFDSHIFRTTNGGTNWLQSISFLYSLYLPYDICSYDGNNVWLTCNGGLIMKSSNSGANWNELYPKARNLLSDIYFFNDNTGWVVGDSDQVRRTTDGGISWNLMHQTPNYYPLNTVFFLNQNTGWAAGYNGRLIKSTNGGNNWSVLENAPNKKLNDIYFKNEQTGWVAGDSSVFAYTTDGGSFWMLYILPVSCNIFKIEFVNSQTGFVCGQQLVMKTTNSGLNWNVLYTGPNSFYAIDFGDESTGWAIKDIHNIYKTTNNGIDWVLQYNFSGTNNLFYSLTFINNQTGWVYGDVYAAKTTNGGANWTQFIFPCIQSKNMFFLNESTGWIVGYTHILKTTNGGLIPVTNISTEVPKSFALYQNYPNPFNPVTIINYELPITNYVKLTVYNVLGKEIAVLVNEKQQAGKYAVNWNASNFPSGVYFYKLETDDFSESKKMVLIK